MPDYGTIIKDPIDLSLIEGRLHRRDYYLTLDIFTADFKRMFNNCRYLGMAAEEGQEGGNLSVEGLVHGAREFRRHCSLSQSQHVSMAGNAAGALPVFYFSRCCTATAVLYCKQE